ncbi:HPr family phosphocarrier protein [Ammoniphilus sp. 3BR4]|uniref:HPr family phosphocarrier protein n=1 Tax=Ammoniphilus sp. 3BR4 TaxID=3158265 RepID=UPI00346504AF
MDIDYKRISDAVKVGKAVENGLINAREMVNIVQTANRFKSSIVLHADNKIVDVKSFLGLSISLLASSTPYKLEVHGDDEEEAKIELKRAFEKYDIKIVVL